MIIAQKTCVCGKAILGPTAYFVNIYGFGGAQRLNRFIWFCSGECADPLIWSLNCESDDMGGVDR